MMKKWLSDIENIKKMLFIVFAAAVCCVFLGVTVWSKVNMIPYFRVFVMMLVIIVCMVLYVIFIKTNRWILIITSIIIFMGVHAQAMTYPLQSPARNVMSDMYDMAHTDELLTEYADNQEIRDAVRHTCELYEKTFGFTKERAVTLYHNIQQAVRVDVDYLMQKAEAKSVLKMQKQKLKEHPEAGLSGIRLPDEITDDTKPDIICALAAQYHAGNESQRVRLVDALDYSTAANIDKYIQQSSESKCYQAMIDYEINTQRTDHADKMFRNLCFGFFSAVIGFLLFSTVHVYLDAVIMLCIELQFMLQIGMALLAHGDGASIVSIGGFTLLELVKPLYIMIMAGLLGKQQKKYFIVQPVICHYLYSLLRRLFFFVFRKKQDVKKPPLRDETLPWSAMNRIYAAFWYAILTFAGFFACSELGTAVVLLFVGLGIVFISCRWKQAAQAFWQGATHQKAIAKRIVNLTLIVGVAVLSVWGIRFYHHLADDPSTFVEGHSILAYAPNNMPVLPEEEDQPSTPRMPVSHTERIEQIENQLFGYAEEKPTVLSRYSSVEQTFIKVFQRWYAFQNVESDEFVANGSGSQYQQIIKARSVGGWFGYPNLSYEVEIAINESDMVFAQLIHASGVLLAMVLIGAFILLLFFSYSSVCIVENFYYRVLGMGIIYLLTFQNILHILINLSLFPIAGIPLMYISNAGTNQFISLLLTFLLYAISTNRLETDHKKDCFVDNYLLGHQTDDDSPGIDCVFTKPGRLILIFSYIILALLLTALVLSQAGTTIYAVAIAELTLVTIPWLLIIIKKWWFRHRSQTQKLNVKS